MCNCSLAPEFYPQPYVWKNVKTGEELQDYSVNAHLNILRRGRRFRTWYRLQVSVVDGCVHLI